MKRAVILAANGFEDSELIYPYYRLKEAGLKVDIAAQASGLLKGKHGVEFRPDIEICELSQKEYGVVLIPGGYECPDRLRQNECALDFIQDMHSAGKIIAAVCHGPQVLVSANILKGVNLTCYPGCKDDIINAGGNYQVAPVVVDKNLITCPHFRDMAPWMKEVVKALESSKD